MMKNTEPAGPLAERWPAAVAALAGGLFALLLGLLGVLGAVDGKCYDLLFGLRAREPALRELLRVDIDRDAVAVEGAQPWSGEKLAAGLKVLAEFDASLVALDLPPEEGGSGELDAAALRELPASVQAELGSIKANIATLFDGIRLGSVRPAEAQRSIAELLGLVDSSESRLLAAVAAVSGPGDEAFREWSRLQGGTFVTREVEPLRADSDGVLRRASLLKSGQASIELQPSLAALQERLGWPAIEARKGSLVLKGAKLPGVKPQDEILPLDGGGRLLLPLRRSGAKGGLRRLSWAELSRASYLEGALMESLRGLEPSVGPEQRGDYASLLDLKARADEVEAELLGGTGGADGTGGVDGPSGELLLPEWRRARAEFFAAAGAFLSASFPNSDAMGSYEALAALRSRLGREVSGSFCIVATAYAEAGSGRSPFGEVATAADVQAALAEALLGGRFLRELPARMSRWIGLGIAVATGLAALLFGRRPALVLALALGLGVLAASALLFLAWGLFLAPATPLFAALAGAAAILCLSALGARAAPGPSA